MPYLLEASLLVVLFDFSTQKKICLPIQVIQREHSLVYRQNFLEILVVNKVKEVEGPFLAMSDHKISGVVNLRSMVFC
jgi:hypothetical protein